MEKLSRDIARSVWSAEACFRFGISNQHASANKHKNQTNLDLPKNGVFVGFANGMKETLRADLVQAKTHNWQLEAWAVFPNHYHFVARGAPDSAPMTSFLQELHSLSAIKLNERTNTPARQVWHNFRGTRLTYQHAYLARLNYVHQNAVKHGLVKVANQYRWCSAAWFERVASCAQVKTIYSLKIDAVKIPDDFD